MADNVSEASPSSEDSVAVSATDVDVDGASKEVDVKDEPPGATDNLEAPQEVESVPALPSPPPPPPPPPPLDGHAGNSDVPPPSPPPPDVQASLPVQEPPPPEDESAPTAPAPPSPPPPPVETDSEPAATKAEKSGESEQAQEAPKSPIEKFVHFSSDTKDPEAANASKKKKKLAIGKGKANAFVRLREPSAAPPPPPSPAKDDKKKKVDPVGIIKKRERRGSMLSVSSIEKPKAKEGSPASTRKKPSKDDERKGTKDDKKSRSKKAKQPVDLPASDEQAVLHGGEPVLDAPAEADIAQAADTGSEAASSVVSSSEATSESAATESVDSPVSADTDESANTSMPPQDETPVVVEPVVETGAALSETLTGDREMSAEESPSTTDPTTDSEITVNIQSTDSVVESADGAEEPPSGDTASDPTSDSTEAIAESPDEPNAPLSPPIASELVSVSSNDLPAQVDEAALESSRDAEEPVLEPAAASTTDEAKEESSETSAPEPDSAETAQTPETNATAEISSEVLPEAEESTADGQRQKKESIPEPEVAASSPAVGDEVVSEETLTPETSLEPPIASETEVTESANTEDAPSVPDVEKVPEEARAVETTPEPELAVEVTEAVASEADKDLPTADPEHAKDSLEVQDLAGDAVAVASPVVQPQEPTLDEVNVVAEDAVSLETVSEPDANETKDAPDEELGAEDSSVTHGEPKEDGGDDGPLAEEAQAELNKVSATTDDREAKEEEMVPASDYHGM